MLVHLGADVQDRIAVEHVQDQGEGNHGRDAVIVGVLVPEDEEMAAVDDGIDDAVDDPVLLPDAADALPCGPGAPVPARTDMAAHTTRFLPSSLAR